MSRVIRSHHHRLEHVIRHSDWLVTALPCHNLATHPALGEDHGNVSVLHGMVEPR